MTKSKPLPDSNFQLASIASRLDAFVPKLTQVADWVEEQGKALKAETLADSIPLTLRSLADEIVRIRADLMEVTHG